MPNAKNMNVDVIVTNGPGGPTDVTFDLDDNGVKTNTLTFKNDKHPGIIVYFNINDPDGTGLLFQPVPGDALWVNSQGTACPTTPSVWNQFVPLSVEKAGKQLIVYCRNLAQQKFSFALRFLWPNGNGIDYDPIGDGQNGLRS